MNRFPWNLLQKPTALLLSAALVASGCAGRQVSGSVSQAALAKEFETGRRIHSQILTSFRPYTAPKVVDYVRGVGTPLTSHAVRKELKYRFTVLYHESIYASSAPGGYVYLTTGLLHYLKNEAELAAVLGHEIAQLQYHNPKFSPFRKSLEGLMQAAAMIAPIFGQIGVLAFAGIALLNIANDSKQPSGEKRLYEADRLAMDYMVQAGYDPQGMLDVLAGMIRAQEDLGIYLADYQESRPFSEERLAHAKALFAELPLEGKNLATHPQIYQEMTKGVREIHRT